MIQKGTNELEMSDENFTSQYEWAEPSIRAYSGCADGFYNSDASCKTKFKNRNSALAYCENFDCDGVAIQNEEFVAVSNINKDESQLFHTIIQNAEKRHEVSSSEKIGTVIEKLNRIFQYVLDKRTKDNLLVEYWGTELFGLLDQCTEYLNNKCTPEFGDLFEAKYYCESLGDECAGVSLKNGIYTTRANTKIIKTADTKSWLKAAWCSPDTPPLSIKLPTIVNLGNSIEILWPIVNFNQIIEDMKKSPEKHLNIVKSNSYHWERVKDYNRYAINLRIQADTVIFDGNIETIANIKSLDIKARKIIIKRSTILTFSQSKAISSNWYSPIADEPENCVVCHGNNGGDGEPGFDATKISIGWDLSF